VVHENAGMGTLDKKDAFREALLEWGDENLREFPWRVTDDPYRVFIAEVMLQRTLATKVVPVYREFVDRYPDFGALFRANEGDLADLIRPLGLQNRKARAFVNIAEDLCGSGVPASEDELLTLPFVGRYAANATLCFSFSECRPIVDTNVVRIYNRYFGKEFSGDQDEAAWSFSKRVLPEDQCRRFNLALLDFGAEVCTSRDPRCNHCPVNEECNFYSDRSH